MKVRPFDPRDIEVESKAVYRIFFWNDRRTHSDTYELTDAQLGEVLEWISINAEGREVEAMVVVDGREGLEAVYLIGPLDHASARPPSSAAG
jgi:hypothetical protein